MALKVILVAAIISLAIPEFTPLISPAMDHAFDVLAAAIFGAWLSKLAGAR